MKTKYPELPSDARTLLGTSRILEVKSIEPGYYYHFGLRQYIKRIISQCQILIKTSSELI